MLNVDAATPPTVRDRHVQLIAEKGRIAWHQATGYGGRSLVETAINRYKHTIGPNLGARSSDGEQGEVAIAVQVINRMTRIAKPIPVRSS